MDTVLKGLGKFAQAYVDDILVFTDGSIKDHVCDLQCIFNCIHAHWVMLKSPKCHYAAYKVKYLGYVISPVGIF